MLTPCPNPIVQEDSSGGEAHRFRYRLQAGVVVSLLHALLVAVPVAGVVFAGLLAYLRIGPAKGSDEPIAPPPAPLGTDALLLFAAALPSLRGSVYAERDLRLPMSGAYPTTVAALALRLGIFYASVLLSTRDGSPTSSLAPVCGVAMPSL